MRFGPMRAALGMMESSATLLKLAAISIRSGDNDKSVATLATDAQNSIEINSHSENAPSGTSRNTSVNFVMPRTLNVGLKFESTNSKV